MSEAVELRLAPTDQSVAARYEALFALYASLYPQLRGAYAQLADINSNEDQNA